MEHAALLTIGDELLNGQVVDKNASYLARRLRDTGIDVLEIRSVADEAASIKRAIEQWEGKVGLMIITGGLGPTDDDRTKEVLMEHYGVGEERNEQIEKDLRDYLAKRGRNVSEKDLAQADMPAGATVIRNPRGSAPAIRFDRNGTRVIAMPGVPHEMRALFEEQLLPSLQKEMGKKPLPHRTLVTSGLGESSLVHRIDDLVRHYEGQGLDFSYLASPGVVRIRIMLGFDGKANEGVLEEAVRSLRDRIPELLVGVGDENFEAHILEALKEKGQTLSIAESCTGGYIAHLITSVPGASDHFPGSLVAYSNRVKQAQLGVSERSLSDHGAVSQPVVEEMAEGVRKAFGTDMGLATSGIMGPSGGSEEKPIGTAWMAVSDSEGSVSEKHYLGQQRDTNIEKGGRLALHLLSKKLKNLL